MKARGTRILLGVTLYPVFLDLSQTPVLVVGGGAVGLRKTRGLVEAGAQVTVVSPVVRAEFESMTVTLKRRPFEPADLGGARLVFACTNDDAVNDLVAREARARGVFCNQTSRPEGGDVRLGAVVRQGAALVAVSTGTELPYLAQALRDRVAGALPEGLPVGSWEARRQAALSLPEGQRELVLSTLKAEILRAVNA